MKSKFYYVVNSFGERAFEGNPAAIFLNCEDLTECTMQAIAKQLNLVETVFVKNGDSEVDFELRYFTPNKEVDIAGHPTVAAFVALENEKSINSYLKDSFVIKTRAGNKEIRVKSENNKISVIMESKQPVFYDFVQDRKEVAEVLGIKLEELIVDLPIQPIDTGLGHLVVPVKSLEVLMRVKRRSGLKDLCNKYGVSEAQVFTYDTYNKDLDVHTRNICPREGIEDPGCGIGNAALGAYLLKNKFKDDNDIIVKAEQGVIIGMPCTIEVHASRINEDFKIFIGGTGKVMSKGEFYIE
ncbi:PhzF family phenazine biosynthesis protein [Clostridium tunisiense]|uniref:PhzF family phenazine biosynthesis protein n=1 Tax=Clostridium tunisiense TaxID=219748 RepID=UPI0002DF11B5|nr:PhzF family phenazine biosynthesis protein [Clostridium tunisiense]